MYVVSGNTVANDHENFGKPGGGKTWLALWITILVARSGMPSCLLQLGSVHR